MARVVQVPRFAETQKNCARRITEILLRARGQPGSRVVGNGVARDPVLRATWPSAWRNFISAEHGLRLRHLLRAVTLNEACNELETLTTLLRSQRGSRSGCGAVGAASSTFAVAACGTAMPAHDNLTAAAPSACAKLLNGRPVAQRNSATTTEARGSTLVYRRVYLALLLLPKLIPASSRSPSCKFETGGA